MCIVMSSFPVSSSSYLRIPSFDLGSSYINEYAFFQSNTRTKVIIMELCTGGSLFNMLDNPENAFGIPEKEFFNVLIDIGECSLQFVWLQPSKSHYFNVFLYFLLQSKPVS